jgi:hypothetical protein
MDATGLSAALELLGAGVVFVGAVVTGVGLFIRNGHGPATPRPTHRA